MIKMIPYIGSKYKIACEILDQIPKADNFYDLFGGMGSMFFNAAMNYSESDWQTGKWKNFHYNEYKKEVADLVESVSIDPDMWNECEEIKKIRTFDDFKTKEDFKAIDRNPFKQSKNIWCLNRLTWSFSSWQDTYLWNPEVCEIKHACYQAWQYGDFKELDSIGFINRKKLKFEFSENKEWFENYFAFNKAIQEYCMKIEKIDPILTTKGLTEREKQYYYHYRFQACNRLKRIIDFKSYLDNNERFCNLRTNNLFFTNLDFSQVEIKKNSVVYLDPPYRGTWTYNRGLDKMNKEEAAKFEKDFYDRLYSWISNAKFPVYISEYNMPSEFKEVWSKRVESTSGLIKSRRERYEKLYWNGVK